jgi:hypothetical protein
VLLTTVLVHLKTNAVQLLLDLANDESVSEEDGDGESTDELRDPDRADPTSTAPGGEEPDNAESSDDGGSVSVDGVGDGFERVLIDGGREGTKVNVGRLDGVRGGLADRSVGACALVVGDVGGRTGSVEVGRVDVLRVE